MKLKDVMMDMKEGEKFKFTESGKCLYKDSNAFRFDDDSGEPLSLFEFLSCLDCEGEVISNIHETP
jgi:hypothetical protein